jgi:anti-sigma B factor antagonist
MSDSADDTATGLQPGTIQLDSALTVSCTTGQADDTILTFPGELDAVSAEQAYRYVRDTIDARGGPVMLDVAGLSFCDAHGLGALLRMSSHARQAGSSLYLLTPPPRFVRLIRITGLDEELLVHRGERTGEVALARARHHRCG